MTRSDDRRNPSDRRSGIRQRYHEGGQAGSSCHRMRRGKMEYAGERPISGVSVRKDHPQYAGTVTPPCIPRARRARQTGGLARFISSRGCRTVRGRVLSPQHPAARHDPVRIRQRVCAACLGPSWERYLHTLRQPAPGGTGARRPHRPGVGARYQFTLIRDSSKVGRKSDR
jgi:hypothetical protein